MRAMMLLACVQAGRRLARLLSRGVITKHGVYRVTVAGQRRAAVEGRATEDSGLQGVMGAVPGTL